MSLQGAGLCFDPELYSRNLAVLTARDTGLAKRLAAVECPNDVQAFGSQSGMPTLRVRVKDGKQLLLHSSHDPAREAARLVDSADTGGISSFMVLGFGLGYHVEELARRIHARSRIYVLEPDPRLFRLALGVRDLRPLLADPRVFWLVGLSKPEMFNHLQPHIAVLFLGLRYLAHPASEQAFPEAYGQLHHSLRDFTVFAQRTMGTTVSIGTPSHENLLMNLPQYVFDAGINDLCNLFEGYPALVVAAGPSLARNIDLLGRLKGRALIITVSTALKPLLRRGIVPDFVTLVDYHQLSVRYFKDLQEYPPVHLVADPKADWHTVEVHHGPKSFIRNNYLDLLLGDEASRKAELRLGATVAHVAFYLAEFVGADPIVFVGQDLGYPDGVTYTPGTAIHDLWSLECNRFQSMEMKEWERVLRLRRALMQVPDVHGRPMYTDSQMFAYLQQFEKDFFRSRARIIDAGGGGARKEHTEVMSLTEVSGQFCSREIPATLFTRAHDLKGGKFSTGEAPRVLEALGRRLAQTREIQGFYRTSLETLREVGRHLEDTARAREFQDRVDRLREQVFERAVINTLVTELTHANEYSKLLRDREIAASGATGLELKHMKLERDITNLEGLLETACLLESLLMRGIARTESYSQAVTPS